MKVLFVCTGNICRSPMAEYYFRSLIERASLQDRMSAESAGTYADNGSPVTYESFVVMKERYGIDISRHASRYLSHSIAFDADLILVMTASHRQSILSKMPDLYARTHLILEYASDPANGEVSDPYGSDLPVYEGCFERMRPALDNLFLDLMNRLTGDVIS